MFISWMLRALVYTKEIPNELSLQLQVPFLKAQPTRCFLLLLQFNLAQQVPLKRSSVKEGIYQPVKQLFQLEQKYF